METTTLVKVAIPKKDCTAQYKHPSCWYQTDLGANPDCIYCLWDLEQGTLNLFCKID